MYVLCSPQGNPTSTRAEVVGWVSFACLHDVCTMLGPNTFPIHKRRTDTDIHTDTHTQMYAYMSTALDIPVGGIDRSGWETLVYGTYTYYVDDLGVHSESKPECPDVRGIRKPDS